MSLITALELKYNLNRLWMFQNMVGWAREIGSLWLKTNESTVSLAQVSADFLPSTFHSLSHPPWAILYLDS